MPRLTPRATRSSPTGRSAASKSLRARSGTTARTTATTAPVATPGDAEKLRAELRQIGERRTKLTAEVAELEADTGESIRRAKGKLGMTEVAQLLGLHRTSLYRTYGA